MNKQLGTYIVLPIDLIVLTNSIPFEDLQKLGKLVQYTLTVYYLIGLVSWLSWISVELLTSFLPGQVIQSIQQDILSSLAMINPLIGLVGASFFIIWYNQLQKQLGQSLSVLSSLFVLPFCIQSDGFLL